MSRSTVSCNSEYDSDLDESDSSVSSSRQQTPPKRKKKISPPKNELPLKNELPPKNLQRAGVTKHYSHGYLKLIKN